MLEVLKTPAKAGRRQWMALAVLCLPMLIVSMDVSVLFFAVPFIAGDLQPSATQQLWIFDIYGFVLAALLLTMGVIGDRIGRRRLLLIGAVAFSAASLLAAWSGSAEMLILARGLMGLGGATLMPSTLALIRNVFHDEAERTKAVGIWSAVMATGVSVGPVLSGLLLEHFWWGSVFLVNIPVMLVLVGAAPILVPESRSLSPRSIDVLSAMLCLGAVLPFIYGIKQLAADGRATGYALLVAAGLACGVLFWLRQRRVAHPLLDLELFSYKGFGGSVAVNMIATVGIIGNAILITAYLQSVLGFSPLVAALWSLAPAAVVGVIAPTAAALATRFGRPLVMAGGLVIAAAGFGALTEAGQHSSVWLVLIGATLVAGGIVSVLTLVTDFVIGSVPADRAGSTAGFLETTTEFAGALGIAVLGSVLNAVYRHHMQGAAVGSLPAGAAAGAKQDLAGVVTAAGELPAGQGAALLQVGRASYVTGMHIADLVAAGLMVVGVIIALTRLPKRSARVSNDGGQAAGSDAASDGELATSPVVS